MENLHTWIAIIGGVAGALALFDRFRNRRPVLRAFAPYYWNSVDADSGIPILAIYFRIANHSKENAFIYLETSQLEIYHAGKWHKTNRLDLNTKKDIQTDMPEGKRIAMGINEAPFLSKFNSGTIAFDKPLCGYLLFSSQNEVSLSSFSRLRYTVRDCQFRKHVFKIDMAEQKKSFDPFNQQ